MRPLTRMFCYPTTSPPAGVALIPLPGRFVPPGIFPLSILQGSAAPGSSDIRVYSGLSDLADAYPQSSPRVLMVLMPVRLSIQLNHPACTLLARLVAAPQVLDHRLAPRGL